MSFAASDVYIARTRTPSDAGVLVLAGSSGRLDVSRADVLADAGATALAIRWFGGAGPSAVAGGGVGPHTGHTWRPAEMT